MEKTAQRREAFRKCESYLLLYVPNILSEQFVTIGVLFKGQRSGQSPPHLEARFLTDWSKVKCLDPNADVALLRSLVNEIGNKWTNPSLYEELLDRLRNTLSNTVRLCGPTISFPPDPRHELELLTKVHLSN